VLAPPLIEEPATAVSLFPSIIRVTTDSIALMGRIPGHIIGRAVVDTRLNEMRECKFDMRSFARACLCAELTEENQWSLFPLQLRQLGLFEVDDRKRRFLRWTPYCIATLLRDDLLSALCSGLASLAEHHNGKVWEFIVALAIVLHRLAGVPHTYLAPAGEGSHIRVVSAPQTVATWKSSSDGSTTRKGMFSHCLPWQTSLAPTWWKPLMGALWASTS
jgi:hypothetical protein